MSLASSSFSFFFFFSSSSRRARLFARLTNSEVNLATALEPSSVNDFLHQHKAEALDTTPIREIQAKTMARFKKTYPLLRRSMKFSFSSAAGLAPELEHRGVTSMRSWPSRS